MKLTQHVFISFSAASLVLAASPANAVKPRAAATTSYCAVVTKAVTALKQQSATTAFCQSYLSSVTTSTSTTSTVSFNTDPRTCGPPESDNVCPTNNKRRNAAVQTQKPTPKPKPACFSKYTVGQALSSACSCLSVPVSTVTATTTSTNCIPQGTIAYPTSFYILPTSGVAAGQYAHVQANGNVSFVGGISGASVFKRNDVPQNGEFEPLRLGGVGGVLVGTKTDALTGTVTGYANFGAQGDKPLSARIDVSASDCFLYFNDFSDFPGVVGSDNIFFFNTGSFFAFRAVQA